MKKALSAMMLSLLASASQAGFILGDGGVNLPSLIGDDFGFRGPRIAGADVSIDREADVTFALLYQESDYRNYFISIGGTLFDDVEVGSSFTTRLQPGLLPFRFGSMETGIEAVNGENVANYATGNAQFLVHLDGILPWAFMVGFNDSWTGDYDFDDMVIRVIVDDVVPTPTAVPEPMPAMLLGIGLAGVGLARRVRSRMV